MYTQAYLSFTDTDALVSTLKKAVVCWSFVSVVAV